MTLIIDQKRVIVIFLKIIVWKIGFDQLKSMSIAPQQSKNRVLNIVLRIDVQILLK